MELHTPFTRRLAVVLVFVMFRTSFCVAASLTPGSLALLDGALPGPEMQAAWELASRRAHLDPHILVMREDDVTLLLERWRGEGEAVRSAWRTADSAALQTIGNLHEKAWSAYYAFSFHKALGFLEDAEELLAASGDTRSRSRLAFDGAVLKGMVERAENNRDFVLEFKKAAAIDQESELSPDRYSPEIITAYARVRAGLLEKEPVFVTIEGTPSDAMILVDGKPAGESRKTRTGVPAGRHFLEADAPGYERWCRVLDIEEWESPSVRFSLFESGPEGDPAPFFLKRLQAGDRSYLSRLVEMLDVDYVLIPDGDNGTLRAWLVDREGRTAANGTLWNPGEEQAVADERVSSLLAPLRMEWGDPGDSGFSQMNLPPVPVTQSGKPEEIENVSAWQRYAPVIGLLLLIGVAASSDSESGGTRIEVTW